MQLQPMPTDPSATPVDPSQSQATPGYSICIDVGGDGQIKVSTEPLDDDSDDSSGQGGEMEGGEAPGIQAASIEDAMKIAKNIFDNQGQMPSQDQGMSPEQAFSGGFKQGFDQG